MTWPLKPVNDLGPVPRPTLEVEINGLLVDAFIDTGASACLFDAAFAELFGIDLEDYAEFEVIRYIANRALASYPVEVTLSVAGRTWTTTVWFCVGAEFPVQILGMVGFLDQFVFTLDANAGVFDLT